MNDSTDTNVPVAPVDGVKVLVVEDDKFLMKVYQSKLTKEGFNVLAVSDGEEAIAKAKAEKPQMVLLDLIIPKKDGFEVLAALKDDPELQSIPVLILSNLGQNEDLKKAMALGAVDYVVKSDMSIEDVLTKIRQYLA